MLHEIVASQPTREPHRRWFSNDDFDLVVWFDEIGAIAGFQLGFVEAANALEPTIRAFVVQRLQEAAPAERH